MTQTQKDKDVIVSLQGPINDSSSVNLLVRPRSTEKSDKLKYCHHAGEKSAVPHRLTLGSVPEKSQAGCLTWVLALVSTAIMAFIQCARTCSTVGLRGALSVLRQDFDEQASGLTALTACTSLAQGSLAHVLSCYGWQSASNHNQASCHDQSTGDGNVPCFLALQTEMQLYWRLWSLALLT